MASPKVDSQGVTGTKRSRNEVPQKSGDWSCPKCGNLNFAFRTICNRGSCAAPRPSASPNIGAFDHASPFYPRGTAGPPLPLGIPGGYGSPVPLPAMRYDYGAPGGVPGPYGFMPPPYGPSRSFGGMAYGHGTALDGFAFPGPPLPYQIPPGPWNGGSSFDNSASRKRRGGPDGSDGDWICPKCDNVNFAFRTECNMKKCGAPRPTAVSSGHGSDKTDPVAPEGSWVCTKCENVNYPFRTVCNRRGCKAEKPAIESS